MHNEMRICETFKENSLIHSNGYGYLMPLFQDKPSAYKGGLANPGSHQFLFHRKVESQNVSKCRHSSYWLVIIKIKRLPKWSEEGTNGLF